MKTPSHKLAAFCATVIMASATFRTSAGYTDATAPAIPAAHPDRTYTGTITAMNPKSQRMKVQGWTMFHRSFSLGHTCAYVLPGNLTGSIDDLRPGEKVTVSYQKVHGVRIAGRVTQIPVTFEGKITMVDPIAQQMVVHQPGLDKPMVIGTGCKVMLSDRQPGTHADIRVGDHVIVTYEMPDETPTMRQIARTRAFEEKL